MTSVVTPSPDGNGGHDTEATPAPPPGNSHSVPSFEFTSSDPGPAQSHAQAVEMTDLSAGAGSEATPLPTAGEHDNTRTTDPDAAIVKNAPDTVEPAESSGPAPEDSNAISSLQTDSAIGPATDQYLAKHPSSSSGLQVVIVLLMHSTETRHPYVINEKYLKKRNISVPDDSPLNISVYTLKDLIWRDWRDDWEPRPTSPTSIRLIHMGRLLDDKAYLKDSRFSTGETPHVVHMTIKPQEVVDDEDARMAKGGGRDREGHERSHGCRCVVM